MGNNWTKPQQKPPQEDTLSLRNSSLIADGFNFSLPGVGNWREIRPEKNVGLLKKREKENLRTTSSHTHEHCQEGQYKFQLSSSAASVGAGHSAELPARPPLSCSPPPSPHWMRPASCAWGIHWSCLGLISNYDAGCTVINFLWDTHYIEHMNVL